MSEETVIKKDSKNTILSLSLIFFYFEIIPGSSFLMGALGNLELAVTVLSGKVLLRKLVGAALYGCGCKKVAFGVGNKGGSSAWWGGYWILWLGKIEGGFL